MKKFIEVTDVSTDSKLAINVDYIVAVEDLVSDCHILHEQYDRNCANCFEVKETYSEVMDLISEALGA